MDQRERFSDDEEALRLAVAGVLKHMHFAHVSIVAHDSDGHVVVSTPAIKRRDIDQNGQTVFVDHPVLPDQPLHFVGGGGVTLTHSIKAGDELISIIASRPIDTWKQQGGTSPPAFTRMQSLSDAVALSGVRSDPRRLQQVSTSSTQMRDDAKHHVSDHDPQAGITHQSVDPSTPPASESFDPFTQATKFFRHIVQGAVGIVGSAVSGSTTHTHGVDHDQGGWMSAMASGGTNFVRAHPVLGSLISALDGKHSVTATLGGVMLQSATSISMDCPPSGLSLPNGSVNSLSLSAGAAASNVGQLGGDLAGTLPNPQVAGLGHVDAHLLPAATSDATAATAGVPLGGLYRNTAVSSGVSLLAVRMV